MPSLSNPYRSLHRRLTQLSLPIIRAMETRTKPRMSLILHTERTTKERISHEVQTQQVQIKLQSTWGLPRNVSPTYYSAFWHTE